MQLNPVNHRFLTARASHLSLRLLFSVLASIAIPLTSQAALLWNYSSTDGTTTISGQLQTDGEFSDTVGTGIHEFTILEWFSFEVNGQDVNWDNGVNSNPPTIPVSTEGRDKFTWSQSSGHFQTLGTAGSGRYDHTIHGRSELGDFGQSGTFRNQIYITDHNNTTTNHMRQSLVFEANPSNVFFTPTLTILTPVPEPVETLLISLTAIVGFIVLNRQNRTRNLQQVE